MKTGTIRIGKFQFGVDMPKFRLRSLIFLIAIVMNTICYGKSPSAYPGYIIIPVNYIHYGSSPDSAIPVIEGTFADQKSRLFIIDTGAALTTIDTQLADELGFKTEVSSDKIMGGADKIRHHADKILIPDLELNHFIAKNNFAYTQNKSFIKVNNQPVAGMIGLDFLKKYHAIWDVGKKQLYLRVKNVDSPQSFNSKLHSIELIPTTTGHLVINVQVNHHKSVPFLLDSGVHTTIMSLAYAKTLGLNLRPLTAGKGSGGGEMNLWQGTLKHMTVSAITQTDKTVLITDLTNAKVGLILFGALGFEWMEEQKIIIDFDQNKIWF